MKTSLLLLALVLAASTCFSLNATLTAAETGRPNILYFYVDDMGWGSIGPNGQACAAVYSGLQAMARRSGSTASTGLSSSIKARPRPNQPDASSGSPSRIRRSRATRSSRSSGSHFAMHMKLPKLEWSRLRVVTAPVVEAADDVTPKAPTIAR